MKILAINPGSTSTKIAVYEDEREIFKETLEHSAEELKAYENIVDQYPMRKELVKEALKTHGIAEEELDGVVGRGGPVAPLHSGAYEVNEALCHKLRHDPLSHHASNLAALIAYDMAGEHHIPAYIYDAVSTDELSDIARVTGLKEIKRTCLAHALNMRANAIRYAESQGEDYREKTYIIAHLGGGITVSIFQNGKMVDVASDDEGPFSPERSGGLPLRKYGPLVAKEGLDVMKKRIQSQGGLMSHLGTTDVREAEKMAENGDEYADLILEALTYQVSKAIGALAAVAEGAVDVIILTGGIAHSERITKAISKRVQFIAPIVIVPGENELEALAHGALRVLRGEETARIFKP